MNKATYITAAALCGLGGLPKTTQGVAYKLRRAGCRYVKEGDQPAQWLIADLPAEVQAAIERGDHPEKVVRKYQRKPKMKEEAEAQPTGPLSTLALAQEVVAFVRQLGHQGKIERHHGDREALRCALTLLENGWC